MKFETLTYAASPTDFSVGCASGPQEALSTSPQGGLSAAHFSDVMSAFLLRVAAYFQGCLANLPRIERSLSVQPESARLTMVDAAIDNSSEPLQRVRLNRHLSRRLRWLIRRGRVERSGKIRFATADDEARCNLTPGQFNEYSIRVHGHSRTRIYGLNRAGRAMMLLIVGALGLQGGAASLRRARVCKAPLSPD